MEKAEHTGTLEIQKPSGAAMLLLVRGRLSNTYWESAAGSTFEKREAQQRLDEALDQPGDTQVYLSDFSRDVWKSRHEVQDSIRSRLQPRDAHVATPAEQLVTEEQALRSQVLEELCAELPVGGPGLHVRPDDGRDLGPPRRKGRSGSRRPPGGEGARAHAVTCATWWRRRTRTRSS